MPASRPTTRQNRDTERRDSAGRERHKRGETYRRAEEEGEISGREAGGTRWIHGSRGRGGDDERVSRSLRHALYKSDHKQVVRYGGGAEAGRSRL